MAILFWLNLFFKQTSNNGKQNKLGCVSFLQEAVFAESIFGDADEKIPIQQQSIVLVFLGPCWKNSLVFKDEWTCTF